MSPGEEQRELTREELEILRKLVQREEEREMLPLCAAMGAAVLGLLCLMHPARAAGAVEAADLGRYLLTKQT